VFLARLAREEHRLVQDALGVVDRGHQAGLVVNQDQGTSVSIQQHGADVSAAHGTPCRAHGNDHTARTERAKESAEESANEKTP